MIGICGRQGSGKTTISNYLCKNIILEKQVIPINFICETVFNNTDDINKTILTNLFKTYIDTNFTLPDICNIKYKDFISSDTMNKFISLSFADSLKIITSIIFKFNYNGNDDIYDILCGDDYNTRTLREQIKTINYNICGSLTGRECLEYLGTNIFRNNIDKNIWINIFDRISDNYIKQGCHIIIPDVRFINEKQYIESKKGTMLFIYKSPNELILTEQDNLSHISKWEFLTFISDIQDKYKIYNNGSIMDLYKKINYIIDDIFLKWTINPLSENSMII